VEGGSGIIYTIPGAQARALPGWGADFSTGGPGARAGDAIFRGGRGFLEVGPEALRSRCDRAALRPP
jgi:hypothetical protein